MMRFVPMLPSSFQLFSKTAQNCVSTKVSFLKEQSNIIIQTIPTYKSSRTPCIASINPISILVGLAHRSSRPLFFLFPDLGLRNGSSRRWWNVKFDTFGRALWPWSHFLRELIEQEK